MTDDITLRAVDENDEAAWKALYSQYRSFYRLPEDAAAVDTTWQWVLTHAHTLFSIVAVNTDGDLLGLANARWFPRPSRAVTAVYLDDVFVSPHTRGQGTGTMLIRELERIAQWDGATLVRWMTAADNAPARRVYDQLTEPTSWVTYDLGR